MPDKQWINRTRREISLIWWGSLRLIPIISTQKHWYNSSFSTKTVMHKSCKILANGIQFTMFSLARILCYMVSHYVDIKSCIIEVLVKSNWYSLSKPNYDLKIARKNLSCSDMCLSSYFVLCCIWAVISCFAVCT